MVKKNVCLSVDINIDGYESNINNKEKMAQVQLKALDHDQWGGDRGLGATGFRRR